MLLREQLDCASFLPLRLMEQTGKPIHFASAGFQPAGQHLSATNSAKSSQSDRSPSDSSGGSNVPNLVGG